MTTVRRRGLQIDDPLGTSPTQADRTVTEPMQPTAPAGAATRPVDATNRRSEQRQRADTARQQNTVAARPDGAGMSSAASPGVWRAWSGITAVGSFRLPHELLVELSDTARELGLPIGMIVTAAITQLLDQPPERIAELVDRADDARIHGRRNARRRLTDRGDG